MHKRIALSILIGTILLTFAVLLFILLKGQGDTPTPQPVSVNPRQKEGKVHKQERAAWVELMHTAAPGTDWKKMDAELRFAKMQERSKLFYSKGSRAGEWDTLANENLVGKWNEVGSFNTAGRMHATDIDFTTETIYAFTQGGNLWKGDLDGNNWNVINDGFNVQSVIFMRKLSDRLFIVADSWGTQAAYWTLDEGITWNQATGLENVANWGYIFNVSMLNNAEHTILLLAYEWDYVDWVGNICLYKSTDIGETFEKINCWDEPTYGNAGDFALWAPRYGSADAYMIAKDSIFHIDASMNITSTGVVPLTGSGEKTLAGFQNETTTYLYLANSNWDEGSTFYGSDDNGVTWELRGNVDGGNFSRRSFNASQKTEGYLWFGGVNCFRSFNGGNSFSLINEWWEYYGSEIDKLHADIPYIQAFLDTTTNQETLLISTDGGLFSSTNSGLTNTNITMEGMRNAQYYDIYTYRNVPDIIFAGSQDQGYQRSSYNIGGNYYFDQLISGDYGHLVSTNDGDHLWMVYPGFAMLSFDASGTGGLYFWDFIGYGHLWLPPLMADPIDPEQVWWGGGGTSGGAYLYRLYKSGASINYEKKSYNFAPGVAGGSIAAMAHSKIDTDYWYVLMSNGKFFYSTDGGETWTKNVSFNGPSSHYFYGSSIVPSTTDLGTVYIAGSGYSISPVFKSTDNGVSFESMSNGMPSTLVYSMDIVPNDSLLFAATEVGPYVYVPTENMWYDIAGTDAPYQTYWSVEYVDEIKAVRYGTYGRGIWEFKLYEEEIIDTPSAILNIIPNNEITIYPNPATDFLQIMSDTYQPSVKFNIYNSKGEVVLQKTNVSLNKQVPFTLDLKNIPAGVYYFEMRSGSKKTVRKFIKST